MVVAKGGSQTGCRMQANGRIIIRSGSTLKESCRVPIGGGITERHPGVRRLGRRKKRRGDCHSTELRDGKGRTPSKRVENRIEEGGGVLPAWRGHKNSHRAAYFWRGKGVSWEGPGKRKGGQVV